MIGVPAMTLSITNCLAGSFKTPPGSPVAQLILTGLKEGFPIRFEPTTSQLKSANTNVFQQEVTRMWSLPISRRRCHEVT